jgi:hypothetical protein
MKAFSHAAAAIAVGLVTAQAVATLHVYHSNRNVQSAMDTLATAGYFTVPNAKATAILDSLGPALGGGLFFTLTIGAGLSLLTVVSLWLWWRFDHAHKGLMVMGGLASIGIVWLNRHGPLYLENLYPILVPAAAATAFIKWAPAKSAGAFPKAAPALVMPLILLGLLWGSQYSEAFFIRVRDCLLLSNPVGEAVNDFYYRYTLYPAETFKPIHQKTLKSCHLEASLTLTDRTRLEPTLRRLDYLNVADLPSPDLSVARSGSALLFQTRGGTVKSVDPAAFLEHPAETLQSISVSSDRLASFRQLTFYSLLFGFPIVLYLLCFTAIGCLARLFVRPSAATLIAACLCLLTGAALWLPVYQGNRLSAQINDPFQALHATDWQVRTEGLRRIHMGRLEITRFSDYRRLADSRHVVERYWLAQALGASHQPEAYDALLMLLQDPHPNVVCQALYGLGIKGQPAAIKPILAKISASDHWYVQWYGYRALKALGWIQPRSTQN